MLPDPWNNCKIQGNYQDKPIFNSFYSRINLPKIKDEAL